ncbi:MAG: hypothetical protein HKM91_08015 [Altererythrobacter sp.]|nr:hypothetical protein [Altererythrobacter sp.]
MRLFVSPSRARKKPGSSIVLAVALLTGTAMLSGVISDPAHAQRDRKKKNKEPKAEYSKEFIEAFTPLQTVVNANDGSAATVVGQFPAVIALAQSGDEKNALGGLIYNTGAQTGDQALQLQGMGLMLQSGKVPAENVGRFNFIAYQLSNAAGDYPGSRAFLQAAIDAGFTTDTVSVADMQIAMAESFISENRIPEGLNYLSTAIESRKAAGQSVDEAWYRRGLSVAYNNEVVPQVYDFASIWIAAYPSETNWRDAINIARTLNSYDGRQMLDLMRLSNRVGALREKYEYIDYVEAADARRLPNEVKSVIEQGYASGIVSRDDIYLSDSLSTANSRIAADEADLPALENDARGAGAGVRTVVAAGDAFLSYSEYAKAEEFYSKASEMPGSDRDEVLTRLGIAQLEQGKFDAASASFAQVGGNRLPIAKLWTAYVSEKAAAAAPVPAPAVEPATPAVAQAEAPTS